MDSEALNKYILEVYEPMLIDQLIINLGGKKLTKEELEQKRQSFIKKRDELLEEHDRFVGLGSDLGLVAKLHSPEERNVQYGIKCNGCDYDGYDGESPEWPCRTWKLVESLLRS